MSLHGGAAAFDAHGLRVLVVGLAKSGRAAATALRHRGAHVTAVDGADTPALAAAADELTRAGVTVHVGAELDAAPWLNDTELVIASPGVPPNVGVLAKAIAAGIPVWGEPELAFRLAAGRSEWFAVTGTNGKTSTTELLAECLDAPAAGNIGYPLVARVDSLPPPARLAVELSSFQLTFTPTMCPEVAVVLNLAPDHLDWHGTMAAYAEAKSHIWRNQHAEQAVVLNSDDPAVVGMASDYPPPGRVVWFRSGPPDDGEVGVVDGCLVSRLPESNGDIAAISEMAVSGPHHVANAAAAAAAALVAGIGITRVGEVVRNFHPGAHRLETVGNSGGVTWVNDSKATNPHAAAAAIGSYDSVVWIAGGQNKGLTFTELVPVVRDRVRTVLTIGASASEMAAIADEAGVPARTSVTIEQAVADAAALAEPGDVVLFSPACASFDQFDSYAARGDAFRQAVQLVASEEGTSPQVVEPHQRQEEVPG